ncbi:hypothetical protein FQN57_003109 [Myotisia sp. PD_48]|nr:hypothetical protein FQN57_003109 [Myotisia sp. PD_48]
MHIMELISMNSYPHSLKVVILTLCFLGVLVVSAGTFLWRRRSRSVTIDDTGNAWRLLDLGALKGDHEIASILSRLIDEDGAGSWPPKANHDSWPQALRPYKDIYLELVPLLSTADPSLDNDVNNERRSKYRSLMRKLLTERVNIHEVEQVLAAVEAGKWHALPRDAYNGVYCCIAVCRHAYRWATIPVVKVAQYEKIVDFPPELDVPWPYLQRKFGVAADSGNNTANVLHNFNEKGERVYKINVGRSDLIRSSEEVFFRMFYDVEVMAFPIYYEMIRATIAFDMDDKISCLKHLETVTFKLRDLLLIFYDNLTESRISKSVWISYVQSFQGWGVGRMVDGEFVKYDGLSGNHVLFFQAIDAFLGMDRYLKDEDMDRYIPVNQRELCIGLKKHSFRNKLTEEVGDVKIQDEFRKIANHLKVFRAAHRTRVMPYLKQPAPERLTMTAGKSVLEGTLEDALRFLDKMLINRLKKTV